MQNVTAGPPEPKRRTIGQEVAQRGDPSAVRRVKFGILQNGVVRFLGFLEFSGFQLPISKGNQRFSGPRFQFFPLAGSVEISVTQLVLSKRRAEFCHVGAFFARAERA